MGMSDPELRKKLVDSRWVQLQHEREIQKWPQWKRLWHRLQDCPICKQKATDAAA